MSSSSSSSSSCCCCSSSSCCSCCSCWMVFVCCVSVVSDTVLELMHIESAAAVVHYDIPTAQNRFASRLLTMKSYFLYQCSQNRVSALILLALKSYKLAHKTWNVCPLHWSVGQFWKWLASIIVVRGGHVEHFKCGAQTDSSDSVSISFKVIVSFMSQSVNIVFKTLRIYTVGHKKHQKIFVITSTILERCW